MDDETAMMVIVCAMFSLGLLLVIALISLVIDGEWMFDSIGEFFWMWAFCGVLTWVFR